MVLTFEERSESACMLVRVRRADVVQSAHVDGQTHRSRNQVPDMTAGYKSPPTTGGLIDFGPNIEENRSRERVSAAIAALTSGRAVLLCDDAERPVRADVLFAAEHADNHLTSFAITHTSGFLQVAMPASRCDVLDLVPQRGTDRWGLQQCVTVDAGEGIGTGISAADRAVTARLLASDTATAGSFTRPGHIVPLRADMGLPPHRYGFAEGALHLIEASGLNPGAVLATLIGLSTPTSMAGGADVRTFSAEHGLACVGLDDFAVGAPPPIPFALQLDLPSGNACLTAFHDAVAGECLCLVVGDVRNQTAVPLHVTTENRIILAAGTPATGPCIILAARGHEPAPPGQRAEPIISRAHETSSGVRAMLRCTGARSMFHNYGNLHSGDRIPRP